MLQYMLQPSTLGQRCAAIDMSLHLRMCSSFSFLFFIFNFLFFIYLAFYFFIIYFNLKEVICREVYQGISYFSAPPFRQEFRY